IGWDSEGAEIQGVGVAIPLSKTRSGWVAGGLPIWPSIEFDGGATRPTRGYPRQWPGGLRFGHGNLDLAHARLGDGGGVRHHLPSGTRTEVAAPDGLLGTAPPPRSGARRRCCAGPLASAHLSQP